MALEDKIEALVGRKVEVEKTRDGKYVALYMSFNSPPPPKGSTPEEALQKFLDWYLTLPKDSIPDPEKEGPLAT